MRVSILLPGLLFLSALQLAADEPTRRAQEELRKRNLYFGDVDGKTKPELSDALKRYQLRKGFNPSGELDQDTANSLNIKVAVTKDVTEPAWPDVPVLKSDTAREAAAGGQAEVGDAVQKFESQAAPPPPAESPPKPEELQAEEITSFVRDYLQDAQTGDVDRQVSYYGFPVQYFDHGSAGRDFVAKDTRHYVDRWPERNYALLGPVHFVAPTKSDTIEVEFTIEFTVRNGKQTVTGKTRNLWKIRSKSGIFKILAINEQRLHD